MNLLKIIAIIVLLSLFVSASKESLSPSEQAEFNIIIDNDFPEIFIYSPINNLQYNNATDLLINFSIEDLTINTIWYSLNEELNIIISGPFYLALPEGEYNIIIYANDSFSRTNSSNLTFIINNSAPTCPNTICDFTIGENCNTCQQDCGICSPTPSNTGGGGGGGGGSTTPPKKITPETNNSGLEEKNLFNSEKQTNTSDKNDSSKNIPIVNTAQTNLFLIYLPYILIIFIAILIIFLITFYRKKNKEYRRKNIIKKAKN